MRELKKYSPVICLVLAGLLVIFSCDVQDDWLLEVPGFPDNSILTGADPLTDNCKYSLEGIFKVIDGSDLFGDTIVLKQTRDKVSFLVIKMLHILFLKRAKKILKYYLRDTGALQ